MSVDTSLRRTKIIFTLGPATESEEMLEKMILGGADVIRLNMAHAKHDWTRGVIRRIRAVSAKVGREVAIMMDIKGPEIRTGDLDVPIELKVGEIFDSPSSPAPRPNAAAATSRFAPSTSTTRTSSTTSRSATPCSSTTACSASKSSRRTRRASAAACSSPAS